MKRFSTESGKVSFSHRLMLTKNFVYVFTVVTVLAVIVPLDPDMPRSGLDLSWVFSMNQAIKQNLSMGREIIFTFGPYASISTRSYHPATDNLMVFGSLLLGLCYAIAVLYMTKDNSVCRLPIFSIVLACFMCIKEDALPSGARGAFR